MEDRRYGPKDRDARSRGSVFKSLHCSTWSQFCPWTFQVKWAHMFILSKYTSCWVSCHLPLEELQLIPWTSIYSPRYTLKGEFACLNAVLLSGEIIPGSEKWGNRKRETGRINRPWALRRHYVECNSELSHQEIVSLWHLYTGPCPCYLKASLEGPNTGVYVDYKWLNRLIAIVLEKALIQWSRGAQINALD